MHLQLFKGSTDSPKRNWCFFWVCLQRSNPCVILPRREVLSLIANRLCTLAMCGVSHGPGPEQLPPPRSLLLTPQNTAGCAGRATQGAATRVLMQRPPWILHAPSDRLLPTTSTKQPSMTSCSGHLLMPSTQVSGTATVCILPYLSESQGRAQERTWRGAATREHGLQPHGLSTWHRLRTALAFPGRVSLGALHMTLDGSDHLRD